MSRRIGSEERELKQTPGFSQEIIGLTERKYISFPHKRLSSSLINGRVSLDSSKYLIVFETSISLIYCQTINNSTDPVTNQPLITLTCYIITKNNINIHNNNINNTIINITILQTLSERS